MATRLGSYLKLLHHRRQVADWQDLAGGISDQTPARLRELRGRAWDLRRHLDRVIRVSDDGLATAGCGAHTIPRPLGTDWAWRPAPWRGELFRPGFANPDARQPVCEGATLFHDCRQPELILRQLRNFSPQHRAGFGLSLEVFRFDGSFLSLVLDLPPEAVEGLGLRHLIRLDALILAERPAEIYARLNISHGPNVEQLVCSLPVGTNPDAAETRAEFDLAYTRMNEKRVSKLWIDLIFEAPQMNSIVMRDVTVSRRPRADI